MRFIDTMSYDEQEPLRLKGMLPMKCHAPEHDWRYEEAASRAERDEEQRRLSEADHDPSHFETPPQA